MLDLFDELTSIVAKLDSRGVAYALVGGLAYSVWVETRATEDIDLLLEPSAWPLAAEILSEAGFLRVAKEMDFEKMRIRRLTKVAEADVLVLDLLLADPPFDRGLESAIVMEHEGHKFRIARPEVLIELKTMRLSPRDKLDIIGLEQLLNERNGHDQR